MAFDRRQPPLVYGEALFDCFPDGSRVLGGAPFNVACHLQAFGASPVFISRVGQDAEGDLIAEAMANRGMTDAGLQRDVAHGTGVVDVRLSDGEPTYDIVADRAYDHIDAAALPEPPAGSLLYHGSLALRQAPSRAALDALRARRDPAVFVDVNLRDPWWSQAQVEGLLEGARWVKLNADELRLLAPAGDSVEARAQAIGQRFGLALVVTTLGAAGAVAVAPDGALQRVAPAATVPVVDAVGAGDGFASVLILGLLRDWPLALTLARAQDFASALVGRRGATVEDPAFYTAFTARWAE
jgi:fructokinase